MSRSTWGVAPLLVGWTLGWEAAGGAPGWWRRSRLQPRSAPCDVPVSSGVTGNDLVYVALGLVLRVPPPATYLPRSIVFRTCSLAVALPPCCGDQSVPMRLSTCF